MAVRLQLPDPEGLPAAVLFHRDHPADPMLTLQVPNPGATDSETYVIRLDKGEHRTWMERLPRSRALMDLLLMEMHVLYEPATGRMEAIRDLDEAPPFAHDLADARQQAAGTRRWDDYFQRRHAQGARPPMSRLRMSMLGRADNGLRARGRMI